MGKKYDNLKLLKKIQFWKNITYIISALFIMSTISSILIVILSGFDKIVLLLVLLTISLVMCLINIIINLYIDSLIKNKDKTNN